LWLDLEKIFFSTSVEAADENDLNKMRQMVLTAKKMKRDADQMKKTISSLDKEFIERQKGRSKYLVLGPGARTTFWLSKSHSTDTFNVLSRTCFRF